MTDTSSWGPYREDDDYDTLPVDHPDVVAIRRERDARAAEREAAAEAVGTVNADGTPVDFDRFPLKIRQLMKLVGTEFEGAVRDELDACFSGAPADSNGKKRRTRKSSAEFDGDNDSMPQLFADYANVVLYYGGSIDRACELLNPDELAELDKYNAGGPDCDIDGDSKTAA